MKALVTGASRGLGRAIAERLARDGYEVWINCREQVDPARDLVNTIEAQGGRARLVQFDVTDTAAIEGSLVPRLADDGPLDVLVNNAGVGSDGYLMMLPEDEWERVLAVNLGGFFRVTRACLKGMVAARSGRVINIGSLAGEKGNVGQVAYAATKAGLAGATRALALEMARWNILVNTVSPGPLEVGMAASIDQEKLLPLIPLGRLGRPEEVAAVVSFLASKEASYITGQLIAVNGGMGL